MTNQQYLADLPPEDCYAVMNWLFFNYGRRDINAPNAVIGWLRQEVHVGAWQKVTGCVTAGADPVWKCPTCGFDEHVFGIEHPSGRHLFCRQCGTFNNYYERIVQYHDADGCRDRDA